MGEQEQGREAVDGDEESTSLALLSRDGRIAYYARERTDAGEWRWQPAGGER